MNSRRTLWLLAFVLILPGGILLLLPLATRIFGGVVAGLRGLLIASGVFAWIIYQGVTPQDKTNHQHFLT